MTPSTNQKRDSAALFAAPTAAVIRHAVVAPERLAFAASIVKFAASPAHRVWPVAAVARHVTARVAATFRPRSSVF